MRILPAMLFFCSGKDVNVKRIPNLRAKYFALNAWCRIKEHQSRKTSVVFEHCRATGHSINPYNVKVLTTEDHSIKRRIEEAISIKPKKPSLNRDEELDTPVIYNSLLGIRENEVT